MARAIGLVLALLFGASAFADTAEDVLAADGARLAALIAADRSALDATLARELHYVHANGLTQDRAAYVQSAVGGAMKYVNITPLERQARVLAPQVALLTGANRVAVVLDGQPLEAEVLYTAVYVQEAGAWKLTAWQSTPAPKPGGK